MPTKKSLQILRNREIYPTLEAAKTAANALTLADGEIVLLRYKATVPVGDGSNFEVGRTLMAVKRNAVGEGDTTDGYNHLQFFTPPEELEAYTLQDATQTGDTFTLTFKDGHTKEYTAPAYGLRYDEETKKIFLQKGGSDIDDVFVDCTDFIKDGMLQSAVLVNGEGANAGKTYLRLTFNTDGGGDSIDVDLTRFFDIYTGGNDGIEVSGYKIYNRGILNIQKKSNSEGVLTITPGSSDNVGNAAYDITIVDVNKLATSGATGSTIRKADSALVADSATNATHASSSAALDDGAVIDCGTF